MTDRHERPKPLNALEYVETEEVPFGANAVRLNLRQWCIAAVIILVMLVLLPVVWKWIEPFDPEPDYRVPFAVSNDYWVYNRLTAWTAAHDRLLVIGDSVIWGEYVRPDQTLTHYLNKQAGSERFVNGGVSGSHPLALEGLVRYYADDIANTKVILHLNLLWLSSPERDLSAESERPISFNHPELIPQLWPRVPTYKASVSERLGEVVDQQLPVRRWAHHLRVAWFDSLDVPTWTIEHPYDNPLEQISLHLPEPKQQARHGAQPSSWRASGIEKQAMDWVPLDESLQWQAFLRTVQLLQDRGNRVFVIVGPFNAHMLAEENRQEFDMLKKQATDDLHNRDIPFLAPPLLPSDDYGDASHPLAAGYERLAESIYGTPAFRDWLDRIVAANDGVFSARQTVPQRH